MPGGLATAIEEGACRLSAAGATGERVMVFRLFPNKKYTLPLDEFRCFRAYSSSSNALKDDRARSHVRSGIACRTFLAICLSDITLAESGRCRKPVVRPYPASQGKESCALHRQRAQTFRISFYYSFHLSTRNDRVSPSLGGGGL